MKKILITGASGFVGRAVCSLIAEQRNESFEIHAISRSFYTDLQDSRINWHSVDLFNASQMELLIQTIQPTHLLHLAWETAPGKYMNSLRNYDWVEATLRLARFFIQYGGKRIVMTGSCAEYDWNEGVMEEETTPLVYNTPYAVCKNHVRELLRSYTENTDCSFVWGRLFFLYGPYEAPERLIASVIRSLLLEQEARCTSGFQKRDFIHVTDVATALLTLLENETQGTINIASGQAFSVRDVVMRIGDMMQRRELIRLGAIKSKNIEEPFVQGEVSKLKALNFVPKYDLDSGLHQAITWWRTRLAKL